MEIRLEIDPKKESPLAFLNSLKAFLKEKLEKSDLASFEISMLSESVYDVFFAESKDDLISEPKSPEPTPDPCGDRLG